MKVCDRCHHEHNSFDDTCDRCTFGAGMMLTANTETPNRLLIPSDYIQGEYGSESLETITVVPWSDYRDANNNGRLARKYTSNEEAGYEVGRRLGQQTSAYFLDGLILGLLEFRHGFWDDSPEIRQFYEQTIAKYRELESIDRRAGKIANEDDPS